MAISQNYRVNEKIRASKVLVIDDEGKNLGILTLDEALRIGEEGGLDLVEVNPEAQPPVCRLLDYGKLKYQQKKKTHQKKKTQPQQKEIRITPKIGEHDLQIKLKQARSFLEDGDKVLMTMSFRGREMVHINRAKDLIAKVSNDLADVAKVEKDAKQEGRRLTILLAPGSSKKSESQEEPQPQLQLQPQLAPQLPPQPQNKVEAVAKPEIAIKVETPGKTESQVKIETPNKTEAQPN